MEGVGGGYTGESFNVTLRYSRTGAAASKHVCFASGLDFSLFFFPSVSEQQHQNQTIMDSKAEPDGGLNEAAGDSGE